MMIRQRSALIGKRGDATVSPHINFFVMDVARTEDGKWLLIELNDGQMSGLSENNPEVLYSKLSRIGE